MERLTTKAENGQAVFRSNVYSFFCKALNRVSEIEDILGDNYDLSRLRELVEADRDGRCVILPCKVGDTVYTIAYSMCKWRELDKCAMYCSGHVDEECWEGRKEVTEKVFSIYDIGRIGKTVFLTRKAAEAALKGEQDGRVHQ